MLLDLVKSFLRAEVSLEFAEISIKPNNGKSLYKKQRVPGARRLWGTLKTTTTNAVKSALSKLTSIGEQSDRLNGSTRHTTKVACIGGLY